MAESDTISLRIPVAMKLDVDLLIAQGLWPNRATFIRNAIAEKLSTSRIGVVPFRELSKLLKSFDQDYVEIWRDLDQAKAMVKRVDDLKAKLVNFPDLLVEATILEKESKILPIARVDIGQENPVGMPETPGAPEAEDDDLLNQMKKARKLGQQFGANTEWLDKMLETFS